jgi:ERCC4-type nuclease
MANILVHIDTREKELLNCFKSNTHADVKFDSIALEVGDIMIVNADTDIPLLILERKTFADLASSNRDGRYREQRARLLSLRGQGIPIGYLLEVGTGWSNELNRVWPGQISEDLLMSIVFRLQLTHGIPVLYSKDFSVSATIINHLCKMLKKDPEIFVPSKGILADATVAAAGYAEAISAQKSANRNLRQTGANMLCAIPGIGSVMSEGVLAACGGTLAGIMAKSKEELGLIKLGKRSVGSVAAEKIWTALHEK